MSLHNRVLTTPLEESEYLDKLHKNIEKAKVKEKVKEKERKKREKDLKTEVQQKRKRTERNVSEPIILLSDVEEASAPPQERRHLRSSSSPGVVQKKSKPKKATLTQTHPEIDLLEKFIDATDDDEAKEILKSSSFNCLKSVKETCARYLDLHEKVLKEQFE